MLDGVLSDDSVKKSFGEEGDNFICLAAAASTFRQGNRQLASTFFSTMYTLFFFNKNVVFPAQAEYSYFPADFRLKIFLYYS